MQFICSENIKSLQMATQFVKNEIVSHPPRSEALCSTPSPTGLAPAKEECRMAHHRRVCHSLDYKGRFYIETGQTVNEGIVACEVLCQKDRNCKPFVFFKHEEKCAFGPETCSDGKTLLSYFGNNRHDVAAGFKTCGGVTSISTSTSNSSSTSPSASTGRGNSFHSFSFAANPQQVLANPCKCDKDDASSSIPFFYGICFVVLVFEFEP